MRLKAYRLKLILLLISCMLLLLYMIKQRWDEYSVNENEPTIVASKENNYLEKTTNKTSFQSIYENTLKQDPVLFQSIYDPFSNQVNQTIFEQQFNDIYKEYEKAAAARSSEKLLWFFKLKTNIIIKTNVSQLPLFPKESPYSDRIVNQLLYVPPNYDRNMKQIFYKTIFLVDGPLNSNEKQLGSSYFEHCPVSTCIITKEPHADLVIHRNNNLKEKLKNNQLRMVFALESPFHSFAASGMFDWTATYRKDSDIVAPYGKWEYYDPNIKQKEQTIKYAESKTKQIAWFVSNCLAANDRLEIAQELQQYINVDIYGACGSFSCLRSSANECFELLQKDYKFYLSFENSNCRDYITEKFFLNALQNNVIPIVMGGSIDDYRQAAPERSFIHVDEFDSVKHLADYLNLLDEDDVLYNSYFKWKGTGEFLNTYFWCRVCALLHVPNKNPNLYSLSNTNFYDWWKGDEVCIIQDGKSTYNNTILSL